MRIDEEEFLWLLDNTCSMTKLVAERYLNVRVNQNHHQHLLFKGLVDRLNLLHKLLDEITNGLLTHQFNDLEYTKLIAFNENLSGADFDLLEAAQLPENQIIGNQILADNLMSTARTLVDFINTHASPLHPYQVAHSAQQ